MEQYEKVERVAKQAGVTFEEAKNALEACNWDMLDATILLEKQNRKAAKQQQVFSTDYEAQPGYRNVAATAEVNSANAGRNGANGKDFGDKVKDFFRKSHTNHLVIRRNNKEIVSLPIWAAVLIALCMFKLVVILLIIALVCGCKLTFEGPDSSRMEPVNKAVNTAGQAMNGAANAFKTSFEENYSKNKQQPVSAAPYGAQAAPAQQAPVQPAPAEPAQPAPAEPAQTAAAEPEQPTQTPAEFEREDFSAIAEGFKANSVTTEDGKITLEL